MNFNEKLILLLKITQTSNKELAKGISVDPSLISLLRSGKRKQPQNMNHIINMAQFFSQRCTADFQRQALSELLGQKAICPSMPTDVLAKHLEKWLTYEDNLPDQLFNEIETIDEAATMSSNITTNLVTAENTRFYFGMKEHLDAVILMMKTLMENENPCNILISSDDNLEWLLPNFIQTKQLQSNLLEIINRGFTITQIMPAINYLPRYTEALQFWLPLYSTGQVTVHYYPRLRDNLYRHAIFILPGSFVLVSNTIGVGNGNDITIFSTDPQVVDTLSEYLSKFEFTLKNRKYIDIVRLATAKEIFEGKISLPPFKSLYEQIVYTPEIYSLYLKNILRLMDKYENYYFIPYDDDNFSNYNLFVNSAGNALLIHDTSPSIVIEMQRPELVMACYEHLIRKAEKIGYTGIHKEKVRLQIQQLIKALT